MRVQKDRLASEPGTIHRGSGGAGGLRPSVDLSDQHRVFGPDQGRSGVGAQPGAECEPRLDDNSATAWYLFADPAQIDTVEYCFLEGQEGVYFETKQGFEVDGVEMKARMDLAPRLSTSAACRRTAARHRAASKSETFGGWRPPPPERKRTGDKAMQNFVHRGGNPHSRRPTRSIPVVASRSATSSGLPPAPTSRATAWRPRWKASSIWPRMPASRAGRLVYWDDTNKAATSTVGANLLIGTAEQAQLTGDATVRVKLFGVPGFSGQVNKDCGWRTRSTITPWIKGRPARRPTATRFPPSANCRSARRRSQRDGGGDRSRHRNGGDGDGGRIGGQLDPDGNGHSRPPARRRAQDELRRHAGKMSVAGKINLTIATGPLTAGQIEVWVIYQIASNA